MLEKDWNQEGEFYQSTKSKYRTNGNLKSEKYNNVNWSVSIYTWKVIINN